MAITEHDLELYARRVRVLFPRELRDVAEELALAIARWAGAQTKLLRPQTTLQEILSWLGAVPLDSNIVKSADSLDSLDAVETVMALEVELGWELPDNLLSMPADTTYLELVQHEVDRRAKMRLW